MTSYGFLTGESGGLFIETIQMIILVCSWLRRAGNASQGVSIYFIQVMQVIQVIQPAREARGPEGPVR